MVSLNYKRQLSKIDKLISHKSERILTQLAEYMFKDMFEN